MSPIAGERRCCCGQTVVLVGPGGSGGGLAALPLPLPLPIECCCHTPQFPPCVSRAYYDLVSGMCLPLLAWCASPISCGSGTAGWLAGGGRAGGRVASQLPS